MTHVLGAAEGGKLDMTVDTELCTCVLGFYGVVLIIEWFVHSGNKMYQCLMWNGPGYLGNVCCETSRRGYKALLAGDLESGQAVCDIV